MDIQRINPREWNCSAALFGDLVFLSGTVADDKSLDMKGQTAEVLKKIDAVLAKAGTNKSRILSATVYMADGVGGSFQLADPHGGGRGAHPRNSRRNHDLRGEVAPSNKCVDSAVNFRGLSSTEGDAGFGFFRLQAALAILVYLKYEFIPKIARLGW